MSTPAPTQTEINRWRKLVRCARHADPSSHLHYSGAARDFHFAADKAYEAVFPDQGRREPFLQLIGFGRQWSALDYDGRRDNLAAMLACAQACAEILGMAQPHGLPPPPVRQARQRADIDG